MKNCIPCVFRQWTVSVIWLVSLLFTYQVACLELWCCHFHWGWIHAQLAVYDWCMVLFAWVIFSCFDGSMIFHGVFSFSFHGVSLRIISRISLFALPLTFDRTWMTCLVSLLIWIKNRGNAFLEAYLIVDFTQAAKFYMLQLASS